MAHQQLANPMGSIMKVGKQCKWPPWLMILLGIFGAAVGIVLFVYNYLDSNGPRIPLKHISGSANLVPHTSRMFSVPGLFCSSITLSRTDWDKSDADLSWYGKVDVVFEEPPGDFYTLPVVTELDFHGASRWYMRHYHLHARSQISISSCIIEQDSRQAAQMCIIKGGGTFNSWLLNLYKCSGSNMHHYKLDFCDWNSILPKVVATFSVTGDDTYYIVHYTTVDDVMVKVLMDIDILSYDYDVRNSSVSCTVSDYNTNTTNGTISVNSHGYAIVTVVPDESKNVDWSYEDSIRVSWKCNPSWTGFLFVIGIPGIFGIACYFAMVICCSFKGHHYFKQFVKKQYRRFKQFVKKQYWHLRPPSTQTTAQSETQRLIPMDNSERLEKFKSRCKKSTIFTCISLFIVICLITYMEGVRPVVMWISSPSGLVLSQGETRLFSINKFFCSSLTVEMVGSSHLSASVWTTAETPKLEEYSLYGTYDFGCDGIKTCYRVWRLYLHNDSVVALKAVSYLTSIAYFRDFPDEDSFNQFLEYPLLYGDDISNIVSDEMITLNPKPGEHFFVLFSSDEIYFKYVIGFGFEEYNISSISYSSRCDLHTYTTTSCKLSVPLGVGSVNGLMGVYSDVANWTHFEYVTINTHCNYRSGTWAAILVPLLLFNLALCYTLFFIMLRCVYKRQLKRIEAAVQRSASSTGNRTYQAINGEPPPPPPPNNASQIQAEPDIAVQTRRSPQNSIEPLVHVTNLQPEDDPGPLPPAQPQGSPNQAHESHLAPSSSYQQSPYGGVSGNQPSTVPVLPSPPAARSTNIPNVVPTPEASSIQTATAIPPLLEARAAAHPASVPVNDSNEVANSTAVEVSSGTVQP